MMLAEGSLLSQVSLIVAMALFTGILVWLWATPKSRWRRRSEIPLSDEPVEPREPPSARGDDPENPKESRP